jgi:hypothetical protein
LRTRFGSGSGEGSLTSLLMRSPRGAGASGQRAELGPGALNRTGWLRRPGPMWRGMVRRSTRFVKSPGVLVRRRRTTSLKPLDPKAQNDLNKNATLTPRALRAAGLKSAVRNTSFSRVTRRKAQAHRLRGSYRPLTQALPER